MPLFRSGPFEDYRLNVASGNVIGATDYHALGERSSIEVVSTGVDIWGGTATQLPTPSSAGEQMTLVSNSANDASGGTGTNLVEVHFIDVNGDDQEELVTMNGTTPVNTVATNIRFVNFIHTHTVGSGSVADGDITIYKAGSPATIYNQISAGGNMSLCSARMIPAGKSFYLTGWQCSNTIQNKPAIIRLRATTMDRDLLEGVFLFIDSAAVETSVYSKTFSVPIYMPGLTIIKCSAWATTAGAHATASYDGFITS